YPAHRGRRGRRRSRELVEAGERLGFAPDVEQLAVRHEAVDPEAEEPDDLPLVGPASDARLPRARPAHEQRVRLRGDDLLATDDEVVGHLEVRRRHAEHRLRSTYGPESQRAMIDEPDVSCDRGGPAMEVERTEKRRD